VAPRRSAINPRTAAMVDIGMARTSCSQTLLLKRPINLADRSGTDDSIYINCQENTIHFCHATQSSARSDPFVVEYKRMRGADAIGIAHATGRHVSRSRTRSHLHGVHTSSRIQA
jgi:hypothetical protein